MSGFSATEVADSLKYGVPDDSEPPLRADGGLVEVRRDTAERPVNCNCWDPDQGLPCWPCFRDGFEGPNPEPEAEE